jgi:hypothetical protein
MINTAISVEIHNIIRIQLEPRMKKYALVWHFL